MLRRSKYANTLEIKSNDTLNVNWGEKGLAERTQGTTARYFRRQKYRVLLKTRDKDQMESCYFYRV